MSSQEQTSATLIALARGRGVIGPDGLAETLPTNEERLVRERLLASGADGALVEELTWEARELDARARRIVTADVLTDPVERAARQALDGGALTPEQLRQALIDDAIQGQSGLLGALLARAGQDSTKPTSTLGRTLAQVRAESPPDPSAGPGASTLRVRQPLSDGRRLGRYPIISTLGRGGMGEVLAVVDETLGRSIAAKVIRGEPDALTLQKFVLEARITGQLQHPAIVPAYELGETEDGRPYLTMKRVEGDELSAVIAAVRRERAGGGDPGGSSAQRRRQQPRQAADGGLPAGLLRMLRIWLKVCDGVAFAHSQGVIHRDLKPANIMTGLFGEVLVMDWGLAKRLDSEGEAREGGQVAGGGEPLATLDGDVLGTPAYMSPEQARGQLDRVDTRSDVYALGAILYELLALEPPYRGGSSLAILDQVVEGPPPPPSERVGTGWAVPWELEAIVERAMARRREDRYPGVRALAADVERFISGHIVGAADYSALQRAAKFARRNWRMVSAAAIALVAIIGSLTFGVVRARQEAARIRVEQRRTIAALEQASEARRKAQQSERRALESERRARTNLRTAEQMGALKTLDALRSRAIRGLDWTPPARDAQGLTGELLHPPSRARLTAAGAEIRRWLGESQAFRARRADVAAALDALAPSARATSDRQARWLELQRDIYRRILAGIEDLGGLTERVEARAERIADRARRARQADVAAWQAVVRRIASNPRYRAGLVLGQRLQLPPQVDLQPLGPDPRSGLEEFAHLPSGEVPAREAGQLRLTDRSAIVLILVPAGRAVLGSDEPLDKRMRPQTGPRHTVELDAFLIAKTELTQAQWLALGGPNESGYRPGNSLGVRATLRHPVENVSWQACVAVLASAGLTLPTEAQWEAAARGGTATPWWPGLDKRALAGSDNLADARARVGISGIGSCEPWDDRHVVTAPVASYWPTSPHPFGLFDVHGNVREWCRDRYLERAYDHRQAIDGEGRRRVPAAALAGARERVVRGGAYTSSALFACSHLRTGEPPTNRAIVMGCRPSRPLLLVRD